VRWHLMGPVQRRASSRSPKPSDRSPPARGEGGRDRRAWLSPLRGGDAVVPDLRGTDPTRCRPKGQFPARRPADVPSHSREAWGRSRLRCRTWWTALSRPDPASVGRPMMGVWTCGCCISKGVLIGRLPRSGCGPRWPVSDVMTRRSGVCLWRRPMMRTVCVSSDRRRFSWTAVTRSRLGMSSQLLPVGCSLPRTGEPGPDTGAVGGGAVMRRVVGVAVGMYLAAAVVGLVRERMGLIACGCADDCWCKRPGLSLFRWVFPRGHKGSWTG
jgi:hypothetical protein